MDLDLISVPYSPPNRLQAAVELLIAGALAVGANVFRVVPISETPWLLILGTLSLRLRRCNWKRLGLRRPKSWLRTIGISVATAIALQLVGEFVTAPLIERVTGQVADLSAFRGLVGNRSATLEMLAVVWTLAAFGEELAYRGYVLERAATLGHGSEAAYRAAVVVVSLLFGLSHLYQGVSGAVGAAVTGLALGALYLKENRNLWPVILAHGLSDTIGVVVIYLGLARELRG